MNLAKYLAQSYLFSMLDKHLAKCVLKLKDLGGLRASKIMNLGHLVRN